MAVDSTANQPVPAWTNDFGKSSPNQPIKVATPNLISILNEPLDPDIMAELIFQDIGGQELINIARSDAINGQNISYSIVKNLKNIMLDYNSNNIIKLQGTSDVYFRNFPIRLEDRLPNQGTGDNGETVYIESDTENLIINFVNVEDGEQIEIEIINQGGYFDDTISSEV